MGLVGAIGATLIAWAGNFLSDGGIIRVLGGVSVSQITNAMPMETDAKCDSYKPIFLGEAKKTFCTLTDISTKDGNAGGWNICKIEEVTENGQTNLRLVAGTVSGRCASGEISCKARCIKF